MRLHKKILLILVALWTAAAALPRTRWGATAATTTADPSTTCQDPETVLRQFIAKHKPNCRNNFKIQGWRWHTMSLIREASRLAAALGVLPAAAAKEEFHTVAAYVVQFNMRGLHRIQDDLFFPWVRAEIQTRSADPAVATAFQQVMTQLEGQQQEMQRLGQQLVSILVWGGVDHLCDG